MPFSTASHPKGKLLQQGYDVEALTLDTVSKRKRSNTPREHAIEHWAIAAQGTAGASFLSLVALSNAYTGEEVFQEIRKQHSKMMASVCNEARVSFLYTRVVVGTAEIQRVSIRPVRSMDITNEMLERFWETSQTYLPAQESTWKLKETMPCSPRPSNILT